MDQDNKNTTGAPSNDTTSALFVSARKKQLEQQEADRRAKEKEEQRQAAEAEVRRLEREVEERRRKAEEDAKRADEDARRIAEEARAKQAQAAANPDAVLGAPPSKPQGVKLPGVKLPGASAPSIASPAAPKPTAMPKAVAVSSGSGEASVKTPPNMKMIAIIGGAVAVVILAVVLVITLGGSKDDAMAADGSAISADVEGGPGAIITLEDMGGAPAGMKRFYDDEMGIAFNYSGKWVAELYKAGGSNLSYDCVMAAPAEEPDTIIVIANFSEKYNSYIGNGGTDGNALVESFISDAGLLAGFKVSDLNDLEYLDMRENPDGSIEFDAVWNNGGGYASVAMFEDRGVASAAVVLTTNPDQTDYINAVFTSIEVW